MESDHSIGHSACEAACPGEAIQPVFGTEKRGIEIFHKSSRPLQPTSPASSSPAGLGGMGLIRKGGDQGARARESIREKRECQCAGCGDRRRRTGRQLRITGRQGIWGAIRDGRAGRLTRRLDLPLPASETGHDGHVISEHAAVVAHPTVTEVLAACGRAEDALAGC